MNRQRKSPAADYMILDGWIRLKPGEALAWDVTDPVSPSAAQQQEAMRQVRGSVLSFGFSIEEGIVTLILAEEFGTLDANIGGEEFRFRALELRRQGHGLERKIDVARRIIRNVLASSEAERLIGDLAEYRRLRHLMAHRSCWLEGIWDASAGNRAGTPRGRTTGFRLFIADEDFVWEIDNAQLQEWDALLNRCKAGVEEIRAGFLPAAPS